MLPSFSSQLVAQAQMLLPNQTTVKYTCKWKSASFCSTNWRTSASLGSRAFLYRSFDVGFPIQSDVDVATQVLELLHYINISSHPLLSEVDHYPSGLIHMQRQVKIIHCFSCSYLSLRHPTSISVSGMTRRCAKSLRRRTWTEMERAQQTKQSAAQCHVLQSVCQVVSNL